MSVRWGKQTEIPNWITQNDWDSKSRIDWAKTVMVFSPRDWSDNSETWALYCLICSNSKDEALIMWKEGCEDHKE